MFSRIRSWLLPWLRLPHDPQPPAGGPDSVRVFRAGRNFYRLMLLKWGVAQAATLIGIIISLGFLLTLEADVAAIIEERGSSDRVISPRSTTPDESAGPADGNRRRDDWERRDLADKVAPIAWWLFPLITIVEVLGILSYLGQLAVTLILVRLEYEMRWYMVTDRSLRIRSGVWNVQEITMSFANLQQVELSEGPLQRVLGIADVRVQSAGGGGGGKEKEHQQDSLHTGIFHGVTNAAEIRDLIQARLRDFRESGLGDPDETHGDTRSESQGGSGVDAAADVRGALGELLGAARALRSVVLKG